MLSGRLLRLCRADETGSGGRGREPCFEPPAARALAVDLMGKFCRCLLSPAVALGDLGTLGLMNNGAALPLWASFSLFNNSCIPVVEALHKTSAFSESEAKLGESDACMPEVLIRNIHGSALSPRALCSYQGKCPVTSRGGVKVGPGPLEVEGRLAAPVGAGLGRSTEGAPRPG